MRSNQSVGHLNNVTNTHTNTNTNISSIASISSDLVSHRGIWRKIISALLCTGFVFTGWGVIILHAINYTNETLLEISVSMAVFFGGQYLFTGIVDAIIYWKRWRRSTGRYRSKIQAENKEAWVCMRVTLNLIGLAPLARYIESIYVVRRMLSLERQYMAETIAFTKEIQQPSVLPSGSLLSAPITNTNISNQQRRIPDFTSNTTRMRQLDIGLQRVHRIRRQFIRTEHDSAIVTLTSGAVGAGPYLIAQGVLYYRREIMNYVMALSTKFALLSCVIFGLIWLTAGFTHFYPAPHQQNELEFERGIGQVPIGGLILLYFAHFINILIRCFCITLFTSEFHSMILIILGAHFLIVLISLFISRSCTGTEYNEKGDTLRGNISHNLPTDILFSYVSIFDFTNAYAKYTRTRYIIYYFFYYLENSIMIGTWYAYYQFPEAWFYLPALLSVLLIQFLGFILLQIYLYIYSKFKRKTTLCGLCFAHHDTKFQTSINPVQSNLMENIIYPESQNLITNYPQQSVLSGHSGNWTKRTTSAICDPVFGEQISQIAAPLNSNSKSKYKTNMISLKNKQINQSNEIVSNNQSELQFKKYSNQNLKSEPNLNSNFKQNNYKESLNQYHLNYENRTKLMNTNINRNAQSELNQNSKNHSNFNHNRLNAYDPINNNNKNNNNVNKILPNQQKSQTKNVYQPKFNQYQNRYKKWPHAQNI